MWHSEVAANLDTIQALARRFNDSQSEVKVKLAFQGEVNEMMAKLLASLRGGDLPQIVYMNEANAQRFIDSGAAVPLQEFIDREEYDLSDLDKKAIDYYTLDGKLWAMPIGMIVPLLYYNKISFREAGLDPENPPQDLEELRQAAEKLVTRDSNGNVSHRPGHRSHGLAPRPRPPGARRISTPNNENGRAGRISEVLFNGPTGQAFFQWWRDMVKDDLAINVGRNPTGADAFLTMGGGRAAMTFGASAALRSVVDVIEGGLAQTEVELGVANQPGVPGGTGLPGVYSRALWIMGSHPTEEQEAAWKFIKWLMEPEQQAEWYAGSGFLPVSISAYDLRRRKRQRSIHSSDGGRTLSASSPAPLGPLLGPQLTQRCHQPRSRRDADRRGDPRGD
jgi:sn-glycerol 3-phosphate transport system substrate-binding protein